MKKQIRVRMLLREYLTWVDKDEIDFLKSDDSKQIIRNKTQELLNIMKDEFKPKFKWHVAHKKGLDLWQNLVSLALRDIDSTSKGNSTLFKFLDAATDFEDLLYGLERYYRDHTLHSLWVYLIGEYILRNKDLDIRDNLDWYLYNDISKEQKIEYPDELINHSKTKEEDIIKGKYNKNGKKVKKGVNDHRDAIWCLIALCHDLAYSLAKLKQLNTKVERVLSFIELPEFGRVGYSLDIEHEYLASQFLEIMAMDVRIVPSEDYMKQLEQLKNKHEEDQKKLLEENTSKDSVKKLKELKKKQKKDLEKLLEENTLVKCYRDDSTYWRLCQALEKKQHGILSSYLIFRILGIFADASVRGPAETWGLEDEEAKDNIIRGDILFAIAQHEFDFAYLNQFGSLADILVLADELEEFSRYGRPTQSRAYHPTVANTELSFKRSNIRKEDCITINIKYKVKPEHDIIAFFIKKAKRLCQTYSFDYSDEKSGLFWIKSISMTAERSKKKLSFTMTRKDTIKGIEVECSAVLPTYPNYIKKKYTVVCEDDEILVVKDREEKLLLVDWFKKSTDQRWSREKQVFMDGR